MGVGCVGGDAVGDDDAGAGSGVDAVNELITFLYNNNSSSIPFAGSGELPLAESSFVQDDLVMDNNLLCQLAYERGCLDKVASLLLSISPPEKPPEGFEDEEPESICALREVSNLSSM